MKKVLVSSLILLLLVGCSKTKEIKNTDAFKFKKEYEALNNEYLEVDIIEKNPIVYSSIDEIKKVMNSKGLIYLGYPESNSCRDSIEVLLEAAKQTGIDKIYYLNTKDLDIDAPEYEFLRKYTDSFKGIKVLFVKDKDNIGIIESNDEDFKKMSAKEKDQLLKIYRNSIHEILNDLCDESC